MSFAVANTKAASCDCEALVAILREGALEGAIAELNRAAGGVIQEALDRGEFSGRALETLWLVRPAGIKATRLLLIGAGQPAGNDPLLYFRLGATAARVLKNRGIKRLALVTGAELEAVAARALLAGVEAGNFEPDRYRGDRKPERRIESATLLSSEPQKLETAAREAEIYARAHTFTRELANEPSNVLTPTVLAERARAMAASAGLECELIGEARARELGMGAFLSVARGSAEPPVMIVLRYHGDPRGREAAPELALVGKGVTFDTGGISIKPAAGMEWMKFDMCGAAATLGAMQALAALRPACNLLAVVPAVENMPGGRAQKPGDVQIAMSGKSIEVLNTDAEGRLILADALHYARTLGARRLVDSATLTGACVIALGHVYTGVFANNEEFHGALQAAQRRAGDKLWRLPLDDEYFDQIKGTVGDILNTGGRWGGAITAAMFLREFVADTPWIHLDIAGTAYSEDAKPWMQKGPAGTPVFTLIELAREIAGG